MKKRVDLFEARLLNKNTNRAPMGGAGFGPGVCSMFALVSTREIGKGERHTAAAMPATLWQPIKPITQQNLNTVRPYTLVQDTAKGFLM